MADLRGVRGVGCTPLWQLVMYFCDHTVFARVYQMIIQQWHVATTTRTVTHSHISSLAYQFLADLQAVPRPRVALRYSVRTYSYFH